MKQNSFLIMSSWEDSINLLTDAEKAQFLRHLFQYHKGLGADTFLDSPTLKIFWKSIEPTLQINREKFINRININRHGK